MYQNFGQVTFNDFDKFVVVQGKQSDAVHILNKHITGVFMKCVQGVIFLTAGVWRSGDARCWRSGHAPLPGSWQPIVGGWNSGSFERSAACGCPPHVTAQSDLPCSISSLLFHFLFNWTWEEPFRAAFFFFRWSNPKTIVHIPRNPCLWKRKKKSIDRRLVAQWDYSNIFSCRTKILAIFRDIFFNFSRYFKIVVYLFYYFSRNP